ncbi:MAG: ankyrin repeat domain-containing protein [Bacteroidota bacterium]
MEIEQRLKDLLQKSHDNFLKVGAHYAAKGDLDILVEILRQKPHWIHKRGSHGRTMLWEAVNHRKKEAVLYLLDQGADIHAPGCHFSQHSLEISPYCLALLKSYEDIADLLLSRGAKYDVFAAAYLGDDKAFLAFYRKDPQCILQNYEAVLLQEMSSLLHYAVVGQNRELIEFMLEKRPEVEKYSKWLLQFAFWEKNYDIVSALVKAGADTSQYIISEVLEAGIAMQMQTLGFKIDINHPNEMGWPPLVYACRGDNGEHPEEILELLAAGADIHVRNSKAQTALHTAAKAGFPSVIQVLLDAGAEVNALDSKGETPLFYAFRSKVKKRRKLLKGIELLLAAGADIKLKNKKGQSPSSYLASVKAEDDLHDFLKI